MKITQQFPSPGTACGLTATTSIRQSNKHAVPYGLTFTLLFSNIIHRLGLLPYEQSNPTASRERLQLRYFLYGRPRGRPNMQPKVANFFFLQTNNTNRKHMTFQDLAVHLDAYDRNKSQLTFPGPVTLRRAVKYAHLSGLWGHLI